MFGSPRVAATLLFATLFVLTACGPSKQPPTVDPLKEQITVLQRQLLELQKVQLDTRKKVDEQAASQATVNDSLTTRIKALDKALEDHKTAAPPAAPVVKPTSTAQAAPVKKPAKKPVKKKKKPATQSPQ